MPRDSSSRLDPAAKEALTALQEPGEPSLYFHLVGVFLKSSAELVESIRVSAARSESAALQSAAHTWKSMAAGLGAQALAALCQQLESSAVTDSRDSIAKLVGDIDAEYALVKAELERECV